ncbi:MAG TPA: MMPL family transporter [Halalkalibaculum sp.]|nr:MMPL family transporter [Halalkalibaculum sp.]
MNRLAEIILKHPKSFLGIFLILTLAAFYPAIQIGTDFNLENFFPKNDPTIKDYQYLEEEFGRDDNVIMVGFESDSLLSGSVLSDLKTITDSASLIANVNEVRSILSAQQINRNGQRLTFDNYIEADNLHSLPDTLRTALISDPFAEGFLINDQGDVTAFYLEIESGKNNYSVRDQIITDLRRVLQPYQKSYEFKISGIPYYRNQYVQYLNEEILFYISISSVLIILLLWVLYRSVTGIIIPMLIVWLTILFTLAVMHLTGGYFEIMTSTIAPILLCVGIADSIHMISKYDDARLQGMDKPRSIKEMLLTLGNATFLTSITTAIGFGTLMTSDIVPMKRFGIYTAAGVMIAFAVTIFFVPSSLTLINVKNIFKDKSAGIFDFFSRSLQKLSEFNQRNYKQITFWFLIGTILIGSGSYFLRVNGKVFDELGEETEPIQHARFFSENLSPPFPMEFIIDTKQENGIMNPGFLQQMESFNSYLASFPEVERTITFNTLLKEVHGTMAPEKAKTNEIPDSEQLIAQYLLLLEVSDTEFLERVTDFSYQKIRVAAQIKDAGSYRVTQMRDSLSAYLQNNFPDSEITITGSTILSADLNGKIVSSLFKSIALAFALISAIMAFLFKNVRMVFISLIPNILPLIMVAGIMGFTGIDIKSSTAVIFTIAFGIAVDDSIHYMARLRVEMKRGATLDEALGIATEKTGKAIVVTSLILLAGFGTLMTSVFSSTVYMGLLVCLTVFGALLADLVLLPSLFYWIRPEFSFRKAGQKPAPKFEHVPSAEEPLHQE